MVFIITVGNEPVRVHPGIPGEFGGHLSLVTPGTNTQEFATEGNAWALVKSAGLAPLVIASLEVNELCDSPCGVCGCGHCNIPPPQKSEVDHSTVG